MIETPWSSWEEWNVVRSQLYAAEPEARREGCNRVLAWTLKSPRVPYPVSDTLNIVEAQLLDETRMGSLEQIRLAYAMSLVRLVNHACDDGQKGEFAQSVASLAARIGLTKWLVDVRHQATHQALPSIQVLRLSSSQALQWLQQHYWDKQALEANSITVAGLDDTFVKIRDCLLRGTIVRNIGPLTADMARKRKEATRKVAVEKRVFAATQQKEPMIGEPELGEDDDRQNDAEIDSKTTGRMLHLVRQRDESVAQLEFDLEGGHSRSGKVDESSEADGSSSEQDAGDEHVITAQDLVDEIKLLDSGCLAKALYRAIVSNGDELFVWERVIRLLDEDVPPASFEYKVTKRLLFITCYEYISQQHQLHVVGDAKPALSMRLLRGLLSRRYHSLQKPSLAKMGKVSLDRNSSANWSRKEKSFMESLAPDVFSNELGLIAEFCLANPGPRAFKIIQDIVIPNVMKKRSEESKEEVLSHVSELFKLHSRLIKSGSTQSQDEDLVQVSVHTNKDVDKETRKSPILTWVELEALCDRIDDGLGQETSVKNDTGADEGKPIVGLMTDGMQEWTCVEFPPHLAVGASLKNPEKCPALAIAPALSVGKQKLRSMSVDQSTDSNGDVDRPSIPTNVNEHRVMDEIINDSEVDTQVVEIDVVQRMAKRIKLLI